MKSLLREEWINNTELKKWNNVSSIERSICNCGSDINHIELWEHDSCVRGRIDTIVCTKCDVVVDFDIVR